MTNTITGRLGRCCGEAAAKVLLVGSPHPYSVLEGSREKQPAWRSDPWWTNVVSGLMSQMGSLISSHTTEPSLFLDREAI